MCWCIFLTQARSRQNFTNSSATALRAGTMVRNCETQPQAEFLFLPLFVVCRRPTSVTSPLQGVQKMASGFQFRWSGFISSQLGELVSLVPHFHMSTFPDIFVMLQVLFKREHQIVSCGKVKVHNNFSINQIWPKPYFFFPPRTGNAYKFSECCGDKCCKKDQKEVSLSIFAQK